MNIAIIPARGGSQRIPRKNIKEFKGKPIIQYPIETARESQLFDVIIVSTEDEEIANIAWHSGALISKRSPELAMNEVGTQEVARDVILRLSEEYRDEYLDYACVIYPTSPLLTIGDLKQGLKILEDEKVDFVYSTDGKEDAGCFYWGTIPAFIKRKPLHENSIHGENVRTCPIQYPCDINTSNDWQEAERIYEIINEN